MTDEPRELKKDHTGDIEDIATRFGRLSLEPARGPSCCSVLGTVKGYIHDGVVPYREQ